MNTAVKRILRPDSLNSVAQISSLPVNGVFILAVLVTAIAVIFTTNQYRVNFSEYEQLQRQNRQLVQQKNQLMTERTYYTRHDRLKTIAMGSLSMKDPDNISYID
ncbi:cell division protein FtsL [Legionella sp. W05-934-2]|jgi:cell division protein FtsL|uniref:cell division protein FtsL n=1 Tax=Legionella sp. W05-934-2 TaxID=1198649 RepID=UPI0034619137